jgi:hypothetical protein
MKRHIVIILAALLILAAACPAKEVDVNRLQLNHKNGETVLKIDLSGPFQFSHQTAEAADEKPFRIIVDLFPAIHNLNQKSYEDLPPNIVKSIRTSQYSVNPEKVVRVVCDLDRNSMYRVQKQGNFVYLYIPDKASGDFTAWTSSPREPVKHVRVTEAKSVKTEPKMADSKTPDKPVAS